MNDSGLLGLYAGVLTPSQNASGTAELLQQAQIVELSAAIQEILQEQQQEAREVSLRIRGSVESAQDTGRNVKQHTEQTIGQSTGTIVVRTERGDVTLAVPQEVQTNPATRIDVAQQVILDFGLDLGADLGTGNVPIPYGQAVIVEAALPPVTGDVPVDGAAIPVVPNAPVATSTQNVTPESAERPPALPEHAVIRYSPKNVESTPQAASIVPTPVRGSETPVEIALPPVISAGGSGPVIRANVDVPVVNTQNFVTLQPISARDVQGFLLPKEDVSVLVDALPSADNAAPVSPSSPLPLSTPIVQELGPHAALQPHPNPYPAPPVLSVVVSSYSPPEAVLPQPTQENPAQIAQFLPQGIPSASQVETTVQNALPPIEVAPPQPLENTITVTVIAKTPEGFPVVQTVDLAPRPLQTQPQNQHQSQPITSPPIQAGQSFILHTPTLPVSISVSGESFEIGGRVTLGVDTPSVSQAGSAASVVSAEGLAALVSATPIGAPWPIITDIHTALAQVSPQTAQAFTATLPSPSNPSQFGAATLFFVAAVRGGDIGGWLGDKTVEILRREGHGNLLSRLSSEGASLGRAAADGAGGQEWRSMHIPLYSDGDIQKIALHYKHEREAQDEQEIGQIKGTRFVFDLRFDAIGKVQLDGYFRQKPQGSDGTGGPRLDLILRSEERFSASMHADMRRAYIDALRSTGVSGELSFQGTPDGWVTIAAENKTALGVEV